MSSRNLSSPVEWEDSKENFVPVKQGRTMAASPFPPGHAPADLEKQRARLLEEIEAAASTDPLPAWQRYIKWTQEAYTTGGKKSELQKVLEACTKALSATDSYNKDPRYLRIWIQYADTLPDPNDVFMYLRAKSIGQDLALLYEAYASFLELKGSYSKAEAVFEEGISRMAHPVDRLRQKQGAFKQRMARREERKAQEQALGLVSEQDLPGSRASLHQLHHPQLDENGRPIHHSSSSRHQQPVPSHRFALPPQPLVPQQRQQQMLGARPNAPGPALEICVDEEFEEGPSAAASAALPFARQEVGGSAAHPLPQFVPGRKENEGKAAAWAGQRFKQNRGLSQPVSSKLEICEDEEFAEDAGEQQQQQQQGLAGRHALLPQPRLQQPQQEAPAALGTLLPKQSQAPAAVAAAGTAPAVGATAAVKPAAQPAPAAAAGSRSQGGGSSSSSASGPGPHGYDGRLLVGPDGQEQCFEEARAAAWRARQQARKKQQQEEEQQQQQTRSRMALQPQHSRSSSAAAVGTASQPGSRRSAAAAAATAADPTMTINTRHALEALNGMFSDDLPTTTLPLGARAAGAVEPTVTVSTRAALKALNRMFSDDLPTGQLPAPAVRQQLPPAAAAAAARGGAGSGSSGSSRLGPDPTITMSTRAALNALNGMFCDDLPTGPVDVRAAVAAAGAGGEPTLTLHSRSALDVVNGMFRDATTQQLARGQHQRPGKGPGGERRGGADLTSTAAAGQGGGGMAVYEDTEFITAGLARSRLSSCAPGEGGGLGIYEDTEFLPAAAAGGGRAGLGSGAGSADEDEEDEDGEAGDGGALGIYEDTEFVGAGGGDGGGSGLGLYQDTEFLTGRFTSKQTAPAPAPPSPPALPGRRALGPGLSRAGLAAAAAAQAGQAASDSTTALLRVKENLPAAMPGQQEAGSPAGAAAGAWQRTGSGAPSPAAVQRLDSFEVMDSPEVKAAGLPPLKMSPMGAPSPYGPKENLCVSPKLLPSRTCGEAPQPLGQLSRSRAAALGVELDHGSPEAAAAAGGGGSVPGGAATPQRAVRSLFRERHA